MNIEEKLFLIAMVLIIISFIGYVTQKSLQDTRNDNICQSFNFEKSTNHSIINNTTQYIECDKYYIVELIIPDELKVPNKIVHQLN